MKLVHNALDNLIGSNHVKTSRIVAAGTAFLIAAAGVLAGGAAAQADDFYLTAADLTATETNPYSDGWFRGNVSGTPGVATFGTAGLTVTGGNFQFLNGTPGATDLTLVEPQITMSSGAASFQIPVFTTGTGGYTTLYADAASIAGGAWYTTSSVGGFVGGNAYTLAEYEAAFPDLRILAFGFNRVAGANSTVASLEWNGDTYWFLPTPTASTTPNPVTPTALAATGVVYTGSGFLPGETVEFGISYGNSGDGLDITAVADANGVATATFIPAAGSPVLTPGTYSLVGIGVTSDVFAAASLVVAAAAPALAATGTDSAVTVVAGGVLLLGGALALMLVARRRQADAI